MAFWNALADVVLRFLLSIASKIAWIYSYAPSAHLRLPFLNQTTVRQSELDSTGEILKRFFPPSRTGGRRSRHRFGLVSPLAPSLETAVTDCCRRVSPFRFCTRLNVIGYFILLPVCGIVAISYYAVIIIGWGPRLFHAGEASSTVLPLVVVVLFHLLLLLLIWSYFMVVFRDPGRVPENWKAILNEEGVEAGTSTSSGVDVPISMDSAWSPTDGRKEDVRYCSRCQHIKPPRSHHCSICKRCVLKMDHHCVWVVNCIGAHNYKFFILFLFYVFLATMLDTFALLPHLFKLFGDNKLSGSPDDYAVICLVFGLSFYLALSLLVFLIIHSSLLLHNMTTIEVAEKKKQIKSKYDMGKRNNFEQVFGTKKLLWLLPIYSEEDFENLPALEGLSFPTRPDAEGL